MKEVFFVTNNDDKVQEWKALALEFDSDIEITKLSPKFEEIQTDDDKKLLEDKCIKAFEQIGRHVVVEHTSLRFPYIGDFPGGLTALFWTKLGSKKIAELFGQNNKISKVTAVTMIAYCDGKNIHIFKGMINGKISSTKLGKTSFQWDDIFIPKGQKETFAEMGTAKKNKISMRRKAFADFIKFYEAHYEQYRSDKRKN